MHALTHYTSALAALENILTHGFAWVPNRRNLAELLIPKRDYSKREPQQFGIISFTELEPGESASHHQRFGRFGITVTTEWATRQNAQRVIYVPEAGPLTSAFQRIYEIAYRDLEARIEYPSDGAWLMSFENKAMAGAVAGASLWANLLTVWEYLEPESSSSQREWRIVNDGPDYSVFGPTSEIIEAVSPPQNWAKFTRVVPIKPSEVAALVCPVSMLKDFRERLPAEYKAHPVREMSDRGDR